MWVHRNLFWQLSRDGNLHGNGMSQATTASPKPSFGASWRVDDAIVSRGNAGWTTSKSGHPCPCQNSSRGRPAKRSGRVSLLNRPSRPPDDPVSQRTVLNTVRGGALSPALNPLYSQYMIAVFELRLHPTRTVRHGVQGDHSGNATENMRRQINKWSNLSSVTREQNGQIR